MLPSQNYETKKVERRQKFQQWLEKADRLRGRAEVIVAKQRHGATGTVPLVFQREYTRFSDPADGDWVSEPYE